MKKIVLLLISLLSAASVLLRAQDSSIRKIEIGTLSTTHVLFTSDLSYVDISSPAVIVAKIVEASKNMLAIKARQPFDFTTTISALEANGTMHTFYVSYADEPSELIIDTRISQKAVSGQVNTQIRPSGQLLQQKTVTIEAVDSTTATNVVINQSAPKKGKKKDKQNKTSFITEGSTSGVNVTSSQTSNFGRHNAPTIEEVLNFPRNFYHVMDKSYGIRADVVSVYAYSDLTYIIIDLKNRTDIGYEAGDAQFNKESRRRRVRDLSTETSVWPKSSYGTLSCPPNSSTRIGYTIPKLTLQKNEVIKIYIYEKGGSRNLFLTLSDKDVNFAESPFGA